MEGENQENSQATPKTSENAAASTISNSASASTPHYQVESKYPYCKIPEHYYDRSNAKSEGVKGLKSKLVVEITRE